jgi:hypothetical protein
LADFVANMAVPINAAVLRDFAVQRPERSITRVHRYDYYMQGSYFVMKDIPQSGLGRIVETKQTVHIVDTRAEQVYAEGDAWRRATADLGGIRSLLNVPLLKDGELVGAIGILREEVRPFTDKQIELVTNFAAQAVIAIENTRLLHELRESLQQQTATAEVLGVISSTPGELTPVFEAMLAKGTRLCEAKFGHLYLYEGGALRVVASHNVPPAFDQARRRGPFHPSPGAPAGEVIRTKQTVHVADMAATQDYAERHPAMVDAVELGGRSDHSHRSDAQGQ